jgi:hypothetical protein
MADRSGKIAVTLPAAGATEQRVTGTVDAGVLAGRYRV